MVMQDEVGDEKEGNEQEGKNTLLVRDAASPRNLRLEGAHKGWGAEAMNVHIGATGRGDGRFRDILLV